MPTVRNLGTAVRYSAWDISGPFGWVGMGQILYHGGEGGGPADLGAGNRIAPGSWRQYSPLDLGPILNSALDCFVRKGYHATSIREIAEGAGLSVPGVYDQYRSKNQMLARLMDLTMRDLLHRSRAAVAEQQNPVARFSAVVECLVLFHTQRRELAFVAASEMRSLGWEAATRLREARDVQQRMLDKEVIEGMRQAIFDINNPIDAARAVGTMCTAVAGWFRPNGSKSAQQVAEEHVHFALNLLRFQSDRAPGATGGRWTPGEASASPPTASPRASRSTRQRG